MVGQGKQDQGWQATRGRMRLLRTVDRPEVDGPVTQRNLSRPGIPGGFDS